MAVYDSITRHTSQYVTVSFRYRKTLSDVVATAPRVTADVRSGSRVAVRHLAKTAVGNGGTETTEFPTVYGYLT